VSKYKKVKINQDVISLTRNTHIVGGIFSGILVNELTGNSYIMIGYENSVILIASALIGGILPDIDCKTFGIIKHRGFTHSLLFSIIPLFFYLMNKNLILLGIFVGITSHIILDMFNPMGVALLYPCVNRVSFHFIKVKLNGIGEFLFRVSLLVLIAFLLIK
jgi:inner membrane protein